MKLIFENETDFDFSQEYMKIITDVIKEALRTENFTDNVEISFTLVNSERIKDINRRFRNIDRVTDVLSFPLLDFPCEIKDKTHITALGDIMICFERANEQAQEYGHSLKREIGFLTAHSMLHLLGYDHMEPDEERIMFEKQENILSNLGITREMW